jgi:4-carboxymuconolactone decarboxylase
MKDLGKREQTLVSLGAAVASNCLPCIEFHIPEAKRAGLSDIQINEALRVADRVRRVPARMVLQTALARIGESPNGSDEASGAGCGCDESSRNADPECR